MSKSEQQRLALEELRLRFLAKAKEKRDARFEDFMDLVHMGTSIEEACRRIGTSPQALNRQAYRHGRPDIGRITNPQARLQKLGA